MKVKTNKMQMIVWCILAIIVGLTITALLFINQKSFGRQPSGDRLERIKKSQHYREGEFCNEEATPLMTSNKGRINGFLEFMFGDRSSLMPDVELQVIRTDIKSIPANENSLIWFGHSSFLIQIDGKRILVDPVFYKASPVSFINKAFKGTEMYHPEDMPDIDYLIITHDHWDHLDYQTVEELKPRIGKVICGLGVGEYFDYWGFTKEQIVELDWNESVVADSNFKVHCFPARHYSGRGLTRNQTLWASFLIESPSQKIYISGDSGYGNHFATVGKRFADIDLAILENGQYNVDWKHIHLLPQDLERAVRDLNPRKVLTVHHSKYALAKHRWDEPLENALSLKNIPSLDLLTPQIGEIVKLSKEK